MTSKPSRQQEAEKLRDRPRETLRATSDGMEKRLYRIHTVLDHGFVRVVDYMGNDSAIVQAARVSYGAGTKTARSDRGLIRFLMRHRHSSPFEMCEVKLHVKLPIFVARQWIRHRTANVNEYSARYSILDREFYVPEPANLAVQSSFNRQGRGQVLSEEEATEVIRLLKEDSRRSYGHYEGFLSLDSGAGLARELARINLPLSIYTQFYWKIDLHNLLHFVALRGDEHSQFEIREYAKTIAAIIADWVPFAWEAYSDYRLNGLYLSKLGRECILRMLRGETVDQSSSGMSKREWAEFNAALYG